jgi:hypothetical protein
MDEDRGESDVDPRQVSPAVSKGNHPVHARQAGPLGIRHFSFTSRQDARVGVTGVNVAPSAGLPTRSSTDRKGRRSSYRY